MCGLFGFLNYSGDKIKNLDELTNSLAEQSTIRGLDATGIAFNKADGINIVKDSKSAYNINFKHSDNIVALTGHTRHSTQGSEKKNYNNHPFLGKCKNAKFALAHNGVLSNDRELRKSLHLPKTKIETDSYIAVQLLESKKQLNFDNIKYMAEKTEGSFSYTILDDKNNIWLIKGDSPISLLHFPEQKIYVYASTDEILYKALVDSSLFLPLKKGEYEEIDVSEGTILKLKPDGTIKKQTFEYSYYFGRSWWDYGSYLSKDWDSCSKGINKDDYVENLKTVAAYHGYTPDDIDELVHAGFSLDEIEEYIYYGCEF